MTPTPAASCAHVVGMLVPRACGEPATETCGRCGGARCAEHRGQGPACLACLAPAGASGEIVTIPAGLTFDATALEAFTLERPDDPANAWSDLT